MRRINKKVIVAMSGGIDSSVAAALLKRAGFDVTGVFMRFWSERSVKSGNRCCMPESEKKARLVAKKIGIPFYVFNFEKEFKKKVVDYFLRAQKIGFTPNPCVVCNKEIKFGLLLGKALKLGVGYVATGHYARNVKRKAKNVKLLKGKDESKDQSYFLWKLNQKQLSKILFPLGDYTKTEVRKLAKKFKLPVLDIPESQEICFIQTTMADFLGKHLGAKPGEIVDSNGKTIGKHRSLWLYTIGQRKGIELPAGPFYVLDKDVRENFLIVTRNERDLYKKELTVKNVNWTLGKSPKLPLRIEAKIRYRHEPASAKISRGRNGKIKVAFSKPQRAIAPGQSVVFYKKDEVLGGGIIEKT